MFVYDSGDLTEHHRHQLQRNPQYSVNSPSHSRSRPYTRGWQRHDGYVDKTGSNIGRNTVQWTGTRHSARVRCRTRLKSLHRRCRLKVLSLLVRVWIPRRKAEPVSDIPQHFIARYCQWARIKKNNDTCNTLKNEWEPELEEVNKEGIINFI